MPGKLAATCTRVGANVVALGSVLSGKALIACGLRRPPEGWRRTLGILLRSEPTRFALSAFGLDVADGNENELAARLREYLDGQPDAHFRLEWSDVVTIRRRTPSVDVVLLRFASSGALEDLEPHLSGDVSAAGCDRGANRDEVHRAIVAAYNRTRQLPEVERTRALANAVDGAYARRVLSACCLSFETIDSSNPAARFRPPDFRARRTLGFGFLSVVMRLAADRRTVDVWMSAHHVGLDGVPLQDLLTRLEQAWGVSQPPVFPAPDHHQPFMVSRPCSCPGERDVHEMLTFVDLSPVLALRDQLNGRHAREVGGPVTLGAVIAWLLNGEPALAGVRIASTVDVAASGGYDRDVDVVPLRPADYVSNGDGWSGFVLFAKEFNRLVALSRARTSPLRQGMQTAGLLPAWAHAYAVRSNPAALDDTFGSLCVTIIRDAKVFVAPMTDLGLGKGFFAIGHAALPTADGRRVTAISIKGDAGTISEYPAILRRMVARSAALLQSGIDVRV
jgi:hypothetical protein